MGDKYEEFLAKVNAAGTDIEKLETIEKQIDIKIDNTKEKLKEAELAKESVETIQQIQGQLLHEISSSDYVHQEATMSLEQRDERLRRTLNRPRQASNNKKKNLVMAEIPDSSLAFKSSTFIHLTEIDAELVVGYIKRVFTHFIVFQFDINNTLYDQLLEEVIIEMDDLAADVEMVRYAPSSTIKPNHVGTTYTLVRLSDDSSTLTGTLSCKMKFLIKGCNPNTGEPTDEHGYTDQIALEGIEVTVSDHVQKLLKPNWSVLWEEIGKKNEFEDNYTLSIATLEECIKKIIDYTGMELFKQSDHASEGKPFHILYLAGVYRSGHNILVQTQLVFEETSSDSSSTTISMQLTIRSIDKSAVQLISSAIKSFKKQ